MEAPLIEYNNVIALNTKNEPRLNLCMLENLPSLSRPEVKEAIIEADKLLTTLKRLEKDIQ